MGVSGGGFPWRLTTPPARRSLSCGRSGSLSFGDSEEFIAGFFASGYYPRRCRCAAENGNVAAALYWFDAEFRGQKFAYLYAVATHPDFRNRGLCRALMADAAACLTGRGYDGALLIPHDVGLRKMYGPHGLSGLLHRVGIFLRRRGSGGCAPGFPMRNSPALRREYLPPDGVIQEGANLSYLEMLRRILCRGGFSAGRRSTTVTA